ncbi:uncharacterized protein LOC127797296 isoform X2 [Diospyros lotus]|uniref:uncharacterized protein LOC127797296 isoform X2 n=1 Tax=Diospyros lotus TaxID=55363 RepID=UPI00224E7445|nr:uncharacterized protein LOC127797296 isoform X2 [Diospyros lotus]
MTSSSCDLTTGPRPSPLGGCHPRSLPEAAPCTGPQAPAPLPALIGPLSPRVGSDTTCNIPHRAIERTGTTYPDGPTRTSQGVTHPWIAPGQARLTWEFFANIQPKRVSCSGPSYRSNRMLQVVSEPTLGESGPMRAGSGAGA